MRPVAVRELDIELLVECQPPSLADISLDHCCRNPVDIELIVPSRVQRVRPVDALAVAADLHHLRPTAISPPFWTPRLAHVPADMDRARQFWLHRVGQVIL